ncbi:F-box protein [Fulvia fulva]|uniref:F-box protein n=1 Tax=Passalora fulva TaxID=5499 RepID=A0A9Q8P2Z0_PASFU|nr:F-box protein [Fulvia fulva]KAK4636359.1 F-box protein [Fulvia fulva]UJO11264.1 F-box protein [Fulvia fulva]
MALSRSSEEADGTSNATPATSPRASESNSEEDTLDGTNPISQITSQSSNYLGLGCLVIEGPANSDSPRIDKWQGVTSALLATYNTPLASDLDRLLQAGWIRLEQGAESSSVGSWLVLRLYVLYTDVARFVIERKNTQLSTSLMNIVQHINTSSELWNGYYDPSSVRNFDMFATRDCDDSGLYYMFNKLPSPSPDPTLVRDKYDREALEDLLDCRSRLRGMNTNLYPYQRRSAGAMLQRESATRKILDPRLERRVAADGSTFYYNAREFEFRKDPEYAEACRSGVLAETMGYGKTVMVLALVCATRGHYPQVPVQYSLAAVRPVTGSLADMAISAINRTSVPWRVEFDRVKHHSGDELTRCEQLLRSTPATYDVPVIPIRWSRTTRSPPPQRIMLAASTLVVVPRNLCKQWQTEITKHVEDGYLKVLVMDDRKKALPVAEELREYDVILFTRSRFDMENKDGEDRDGRRVVGSLVCRCPYIGATRKRDCNCVREDMVYDSPLKHLHFKRLVVDEGHFFSGKNTNTAIVANRLVTADHKWSVSGTPAKDLLGVEVDVSTMWNAGDDLDEMLEQRRRFNLKLDGSGAIESLGSLSSNFLKIAPWTLSSSAWKDYVFRHESHKRYTFSGFSLCLQQTLRDLVIKTRPADVERDLKLPPLTHSIIRLEPCGFDKLSANLFTLVLMANAITSERKDADYLFHKGSAKERYQLVSNLRQSAFFWSGFSESDVQASIDNSTRYLEEESTTCTADDRRLLLDAVACARVVLDSGGWKALSRSHELGLYVDQWPSESAEHWTFDELDRPVITGISQLLEAQTFVDQRLNEPDPGEGLSGAGIKALATARSNGNNLEDQPTEDRKPVLNKAGLPQSSIDGEPKLKRQNAKNMSASSRSSRSPGKPRQTAMPHRVRKARTVPSDQPDQTETDPLPDDTVPAPDGDRKKLAPDSLYAKARIIGTTSAKLSYLLDQILLYHADEKILVFYQGDNIAYYIAQALDLLHIKHEIYAKSLQSRMKSEYIVKFDQGNETRVLLMDVGQAAFGLNLSSASRIYFVNPVCRPNIEAQAIKRSHRIGQTRSVVVETLVLKGSLEEQLLERSRRMTADEHREAKTLEDDDGIKEIIQSARPVRMSPEELSGIAMMAPMAEPQQLWGRPGGPSPRKRKRAASDGGTTEVHKQKKRKGEDAVR